MKPQSGIHGLMEKNMKKNRKFPKAAPAAEKSFQFVIDLPNEQFKGLFGGQAFHDPHLFGGTFFFWGGGGGNHEARLFAIDPFD